MSEFKTIGVVGAGTMGSGIAQLAATFGHRVILHDTNEQGLQKAMAQLKATLNRLVEKEKITASDADVIFNRIKPAAHIQDFDNCDLVIEAIIENLDIKQKLFKQLESVTRPGLCFSDQHFFALGDFNCRWLQKSRKSYWNPLF
jgi:3-hydroxybutyryl-CoA dehydrogenase